MKSILLYIFILALTFFSSSCTREKRQAHTPSDSTVTLTGSPSAEISGTPTQRDSLQQDRLKALFREFDRRFNRSPNDLFAALGNPQKAETTVVKNRHTGEMDEVLSFHFQGTTIRLYHVIDMQKHLLQDVETTDLNRFSSLGIFEAMHVNSLRQLFGPESNRMEETPTIVSLQYEGGVDATDYLTFVFHGGELRRVIYQPYLD